MEQAGQDVVARGKQEAQGAGRVRGGEQGKAHAGSCEVVSPQEEAMADGDGVLTNGRVALWGGGGGGLGIGVVGDEQGPSCVGQGVVD